MTKYEFTVGAKADLQTAVGYYKSEARPGTSQKFIDQVGDAIETIVQGPQNSPVFDGNIRRQRVWKFPYDLLFRFENGLVTIVAVAHHSREAEYWTHRD